MNLVIQWELFLGSDHCSVENSCLVVLLSKIRIKERDSMRKLIIAGNWKMNAGSADEAA